MSNTYAITTTVKVDRALVNLAMITFKADLPRLIASVMTTEGNRISVTLKGIVNSGVFGVLVILNVTTTVSPITFLARGVVSVTILVIFDILK